MMIQKLIRRRKQIMRNFIATHEPRFPRPGQRILFSVVHSGGAEQGTGTFYPHPARVVQMPAVLGYRGIPKAPYSIPWNYVFFWAPFRGEGIKRKHTRKVKVQN
jgi:hypothetical protein